MAVQIPFSTISQIDKDTVVEDIFFTGLLQQCQVNQAAPQWLKDIRQQSKSWLSRLSVPTKKDEDWRFIDLSSLTAGKFVSAQKGGGVSPTPPPT
jgi:Fe-S cluster assembly protein SufD